MFCKADSLRIYGRDCSVTAESHSKHFCQTIHAVRCIHSGTGSTCRTYFIFKFTQIFICHCSCCIGSNRLKHAGQTSLLSFYMTCKHRTATYKYCRHINSCRCHQKSRYILIAVRHHNQCIKLMCHCHCFRRICDQISCYKGIFHSDMSHCNSVTHSDCRKYNRCSTCHGNSLFYRINDFVQIHMSRHNLII